MSDYCKYYSYLTKHPIKLKDNHWTLIGDSRAARKSMFYIPELDIMFDCGIMTDLQPSYIFITHSHYDHTRELPCYVLDNNPTIIVPKPSEELITNFITSAVKMSKNNYKATIKSKIIGISISKQEKTIIYSEILNIKNINFKLEVFKNTHTIATHGYGLIEFHKCLNPIYNIPEYQDETGKLDPKKFAQLKKSGVDDLNIQVEIPQVCYLLDTDHRMLYKDKDCIYPDENIGKYKNIIIECTFIDDEHKSEAHETKHMLWSNLKPFILAFPDTQFILCHFSMRYKESEIIEFFKKENIKNVTPVVYDFDIS
jgi:ribonuclease Z